MNVPCKTTDALNLGSFCFQCWQHRVVQKNYRAWCLRRKIIKLSSTNNLQRNKLKRKHNVAAILTFKISKFYVLL